MSRASHLSAVGKDRDALALAAMSTALRSANYAESVVPALHRRRRELTRGTRAGIAHCIDLAIRWKGEGNYRYEDLDVLVWSALREAMLEGDVRELYDAVAVTRATEEP